jgi:hypothetical protein
MFGRNERCEHCDDFPGSGKCSRCFGTGKNLHLNSERLECEDCRGSTICQFCKGRDALGPPLSRRIRDRTMEFLGRFFGER